MVLSKNSEKKYLFFNFTDKHRPQQTRYDSHTHIKINPKDAKTHPDFIYLNVEKVALKKNSRKEKYTKKIYDQFILKLSKAFNFV